MRRSCQHSLHSGVSAANVTGFDRCHVEDSAPTRKAHRYGAPFFQIDYTLFPVFYAGCSSSFSCFFSVTGPWVSAVGGGGASPMRFEYSHTTFFPSPFPSSAAGVFFPRL